MYLALDLCVTWRKGYITWVKSRGIDLKPAVMSGKLTDGRDAYLWTWCEHCSTADALCLLCGLFVASVTTKCAHKTNNVRAANTTHFLKLYEDQLIFLASWNIFIHIHIWAVMTSSDSPSVKYWVFMWFHGKHCVMTWVPSSVLFMRM